MCFYVINKAKIDDKPVEDGKLFIRNYVTFK